MRLGTAGGRDRKEAIKHLMGGMGMAEVYELLDPQTGA
jgi:hypothetical protein